MIDLANPVNWSSDLNNGLVLWGIALPGTERPGYFPEIVRGRSGTLVNYQQTSTLGWAPSSFPYGAGFLEYHLNQSNMYVQFPAPPETFGSGSFTAIAAFYQPGQFGYNTVFCGRRTQVTGNGAAWYIQNRINTDGNGQCVAVGGANGTDATVLQNGFYFMAGIGIWTYGMSYDASNRSITACLNGSPGNSVATGTLASARDAHSALLFGAGEFAGSVGDFGYPALMNCRIWNRPLTVEQHRRVYIDMINGFPATLRRKTRPISIAPPGFSRLIGQKQRLVGVGGLVG